MPDLAVTGAALVGMAISLIWRGITPYLIKRKEAEETGQPIPPFSVAYMTTFGISIMGGLISVMMVITELEVKLTGITSIMSAAAIGLTFTYTFLNGLNTVVDLKKDEILYAKLGFRKTREQRISDIDTKDKSSPPPPPPPTS